jgi:hypothetical protein
MINVPVSGAVVLGENLTRTVQLAPAASVLGNGGHVPPACAKSPFTLMSAIVSGTV